MSAKPITKAEVMAKATEVSPDDTWLLIRPGHFKSGRELAQELAAQGRRVRFVRWPGGMTIAVTFPANQSEPSVHQYMQAFRESTHCLQGSR